MRNCHVALYLQSRWEWWAFEWVRWGGTRIPLIHPLLPRTPKIPKIHAKCLLKIGDLIFFQIFFRHSIEGGTYLCFTPLIYVLQNESIIHRNFNNKEYLINLSDTQQLHVVIQHPKHLQMQQKLVQSSATSYRMWKWSATSFGS